MTIHETLKQYFGYDNFRPGQEELIKDTLAGKDVLGIMPTGAGKSMCFQIPALMMDGITLVISPLISLMKDQVNALTQSGIGAAFINSSLTDGQIAKAFANAKNGMYKLIYVAPERLMTYEFIAFAREAKISMLTVDEAHCISQWGQDFRPSYAKIPEFISQLASRPVVSAFTATATPIVKEDILHQLKLRTPNVLVTGFDRQNLYFEVQKPDNRFEALLKFLQPKQGRTGIIYCTTRAAVEEVCLKLQQYGFNASRYHAGLSDNERHSNQEDFLYDRIQIMVATNAFGMGIDKSNVSFVVHYNMPMNLEAYYQEAGRAGRDGSPADCLLLYSGQDVHTHLWMIENPRDIEYPDPQIEATLKERDRVRLKEMTFYSTTKDCLRGYILKYFGETPENFCGNCINCNTHFEEMDVTQEAQKIISCVARMKERFGVVMIVNVLQGSKSDKVLRFGLNRLSTYGISDKTSKQLRDIIEHLVLSGALSKTDDQFPVIQLGPKASDILRGNETVIIKLSKEDIEPKAKTKRTRGEKPKKRVFPGGEAATAANNKKAPPEAEGQNKADIVLFDKLKELRLTIANEQRVPAFVILHDSSLADMCIKLPKTMDDLLKVSGIGKVKAEKFGERFLDVITGHLQSQ
ncbi:MAG: DNA helicase RecQ [Defluviitaleaceae bacterium]|nr:DNA helicase RecQ [Defluviitaleaceae bacterium]